jgi:hypothetical protein
MAASLERPIAIILIAGLVIRLILMPLFAYGYDTEHWAITIENLEAGAGLYGLPGYWYTPVWGYVLAVLSFLMNIFGGIDYANFFPEILEVQSLTMYYTATLTTPSFNFIVKIPLLISDLIAGYFIYKIIFERTKDKKKATYGFALWFLCPLVIFVSAVHGMFDSISVLFMVLAVYLLIRDKDMIIGRSESSRLRIGRRGLDILAGASFSIAIFTKIFPLFIVFALIAYMAMKHEGDRKMFLRRLGMASFGLGLMTLLIYIPQIIAGTVLESFSFLFSRTDYLNEPHIAPSHGVWDAIVSFGMKLVVLIQPLLLAAAAIFAYWMYRKGRGRSEEALFLCLTVTMALAFIWPPAPQYLLVLLPFLIFFIVMFDKRFMIPFIVIVTGALIMAIPNFSLVLSLAAYTDILDTDKVVSLMVWMEGPLFLNIPRYLLPMAVGGAMMVIGSLTAILYGIRYERERRDGTSARSDKQN